jgi:hypothetical protein
LWDGLVERTVLTMQTLIEQLRKTREQIEKNAQDIVRLQEKIARLKREGKDISEGRRMLAQFHGLHIQVLAVQAQLRKALADINRE